MTDIKEISTWADMDPSALRHGRKNRRLGYLRGYEKALEDAWALAEKHPKRSIKVILNRLWRRRETRLPVGLRKKEVVTYDMPPLAPPRREVDEP
jgi:hypothetical protein